MAKATRSKIQSMTGYGRASARLREGALNVELRSINHRYLEIDQRLPNGYLAIQGRLAALIRSHVRRGRIDLVVNLQTLKQDRRRVVFDEALLENYHKALCQLKNRFGLKGELTLEQLLALPQVMSVTEDRQLPAQQVESLFKTVQTALKQLVHTRLREGEKLIVDLRRQILAIERLARLVRARLPKALEQQRSSLREKIQGLLGSGGAGGARLEEAVALVKEADIHEELVRLESHVSHIRQTFSQGPLVGKQLDFIGQELMRETNTMGAKVNDPEAVRYIVEMKSHVERIREQAQNLE